MAFLLNYDQTASSTNDIASRLLNGNTRPHTWASGDFLEFNFTVPIAGWSSNTQTSEDLGTSDLFLSVRTSDSSTLTTGTTIAFDTVDSESTSAVDYNSSTGIYTVRETSLYDVTALMTFSGSASSINQVASFDLHVNGTRVDKASSPSAHTTSATHTYSPVLATTVRLFKGDEVELVVNSQFNVNPAGNDDLNYLKITKRSSAQAILETEEVSAIYGKNAGQSFTHNTYDVVEFDIKEYDSHSAVSSGVFTVPVSGRYFVDATIAFQSSGNETSLTAIIRKNSSNEIITDLPNSWNETNQSIKVSGMLNCNKGDTIDIYVRQINGDSTSRTLSATARNYLSIYRIK